MPYKDKPWRSTWEIHPGEYAKDYCEARGITRRQLPTRLGLPRQEVFDFLDGKTPVTPELAPKLANILGWDAKFWLGLQEDLETTTARNIAREEAGIIHTVYKMLDDDGQIVKYGVTTHQGHAWDEEEAAGNGTYLEPLSWFLPADVAQRKLDKLQRAFANRKQRQRQAAEASANARAQAA